MQTQSHSNERERSWLIRQDAIKRNATYAHSIGNCQYVLFEGVPIPKPRKWIKPRKAGSRLTHAERMTKVKSILGCNLIPYLQWLYPHDAQLSKLGGGMCDKKIIKDDVTGKPRYIRFEWGRHGKKKYSRYVNIKTYTIEIPHWNFDDRATEIRE